MLDFAMLKFKKMIF